MAYHEWGTNIVTVLSPRRKTNLGTTMEIPVLPLGTVLYPGGHLPLRVFEQRYLDMTKVCIRDNAPFGVCLIREGKETGPPAVPYATGCTARIVEWDMPQLGVFQLITRGESVFRILEQWTNKSGLIQARVEVDDPPEPLPVPEEYAAVAALLDKIKLKAGAPPDPAPERRDAAWVAYRLAEVLPLETQTKQQFLETRDPVFALRTIKAFLESKPVKP